MQPRGISGISIEGDTLAGQLYVPRAKKMLQVLANRVAVGGIHTASNFARLDDHAYCYAVVAMGIQRAVIVVDAPSPEQMTNAAAGVKVAVPDFVSGAVTDGRITDFPKDITGTTPASVLKQFWPTPACAALLNIPETTQPSRRLAVIPYPPFYEQLGPSSNYSGARWSQYVRCKPTLYSGRMRWVVQLLLGFGRQPRKSIYDRTKPSVGKTIAKRLAEHPSEYERTVRRDGRQVRYDWRWYRTHGIAVGADGRAWLVEIGNTRGVIAMPLPLNPITEMPAFREKLRDMKDSAGLEALDKIGGFPTGEAFPTGDIEPWIRAGRVIRLSTVEEMRHFYDKSPFASPMGWAWNERGDEAHNTAWEIGLSGYIRASHYGYSVSIGAKRDHTPATNAGRLKSRISSKASDKNYAANVYKVDQLDKDAIDELLRGNPTDVNELYASLDATVAPPPGEGNGHLWIAKEGYLYKFGKKVQYELKFPWPEIGYLVSFDMQPEQEHVRTIPHCDTDVHVFYVGNELKIVRYFNDSRSYTAPSVSDDTDGCELMGVFTRIEETGLLGIPPMVYSTDFDNRKEIVGGRSIRQVNGKSLGYSDVYVSDDLTYPPRGVLRRRKRFLKTITNEIWSGEGLTSAMVVPFFDRCAYYYAVMESFESHTKIVTSGYSYQDDPWFCETWRNFPGYTGYTSASGAFIRGEHPSGCGPVDARTVVAPGSVYSGGACSDFADGGEWCHTCDNADAMVYHLPEPPAPPTQVLIEPATQVRTTYLVNASGLTPFRIERRTFTGAFNGSANPWFIPSPDPDTGLTQYADVTHNAFGDGQVMRYWRAPNDLVEVLGGPKPPGFQDSNTTFVGVVP